MKNVCIDLSNKIGAYTVTIINPSLIMSFVRKQMGIILNQCCIVYVMSSKSN